MKLTRKDLSLGREVIELLREISRGVRVFKPESNDPESPGVFQQKDKLIRAIASRHYFEGIDGLNFPPGLSGMVDRVRLCGGLTPKGRELLSQLDTLEGKSRAHSLKGDRR